MTKLEALEIFKENIPEIQKGLRENWEWGISNTVQPNRKENYNLFWVKSIVNLLQKEELKKQFQSTLRLIEIKEQPTSPSSITPEDIQRAKEYPIENLLPEPPRRNMARCPIHEDKTASFQIKKNNTFTCYGCNEFGDAIDLYQKLHNSNFIEAVKALQ